ncbi:MAG: ferrous iron transporter B [Actinomycetales bacterium]|nr:ferrous iron transporter B [Actinomycetales bacterium]
MSCPHCTMDAPLPILTPTATVALVGNPNVGKSTLFNTATRSHEDVRNAPGTTVELHTGEWDAAGVSLVDLPGTFSLLAKTPDEQVTTDTLGGRFAPPPELAVVLLDATSLPRSLYLLAQVAQTGIPVVAVVTMCDVAHRRGVEVDPVRLEELLGVPVVTLDPRAGTASLAGVVRHALLHPARVRGVGVDPAAPGHPESGASAPLPLAEQLARSEALFAWVEQVRAGLSLPVEPVERTRSDRLDTILLHPWVGVPVFALVMWGLFQLTTTVAAPLMAWAESLVSGPLTSAVTTVLGWVGLAATPVEGFLVDGVIAGVGTVVSFAPLMALMFLAIAVLDDSGYLARAAFVADRAMRSIGLDGRAVLPLIVGFGCNVPALAATRALPDARQRTITAIIVPYTSCAARLTVYILLAAAFFPRHAGTVIFLMYVASVALVVLGGLTMRRLTGRGAGAQPLLMVLPAYQRPRLGMLLSSTWLRTKGFVLGAGKVIVATLAVIWVLLAIPVTGGHRLGDVPVTDSLYGATAEAIAPAFAPAGFDSWQATAALMTGFVAKEVVVGSFAQSFAIEEPADPARAAGLGEQLRATFDESSGGYGAAAALAFMVFVLAYTPCLATVAEQRRILGWRVTGTALVAQLVIAWVLAVLVFQLFRVVL